MLLGGLVRHPVGNVVFVKRRSASQVTQAVVQFLVRELQRIEAIAWGTSPIWTPGATAIGTMAAFVGFLADSLAGSIVAPGLRVDVCTVLALPPVAGPDKYRTGYLAGSGNHQSGGI